MATFDINRFEEQDDTRHRSRWQEARDKMASTLDAARSEHQGRIKAGWDREERLFKQARDDMAWQNLKRGTRWHDQMAQGVGIGATMGGTFGPIGAGIGAIIGALGGGISGAVSSDAAQKEYFRATGRHLTAKDKELLFQQGAGLGGASAGAAMTGMSGMEGLGDALERGGTQQPTTGASLGGGPGLPAGLDTSLAQPAGMGGYSMNRQAAPNQGVMTSDIMNARAGDAALGLAGPPAPNMEPLPMPGLAGPQMSGPLAGNTRPDYLDRGNPNYRGPKPQHR